MMLAAMTNKCPYNSCFLSFLSSFTPPQSFCSCRNSPCFQWIERSTQLFSLRRRFFLRFPHCMFWVAQRLPAIDFFFSLFSSLFSALRQTSVGGAGCRSISSIFFKDVYSMLTTFKPLDFQTCPLHLLFWRPVLLPTRFLNCMSTLVCTFCYPDPNLKQSAKHL